MVRAAFCACHPGVLRKLQALFAPYAAIHKPVQIARIIYLDAFCEKLLPTGRYLCYTISETGKRRTDCYVYKEN